MTKTALARTLALALMIASASASWAQNTNPQCTKEFESQTTSGLSGTLVFLDGCGTQSNTFEMTVAGGPATVSVTINGLQRGGTTTLLTSTTSTTSTNLQTVGGPYDKYQIVYTLTGGASPSLTFNRTGSSQSARAGGYNGAPNGATIAGVPGVIRTGASWAADIGAAYTKYPGADISLQGYQYPNNFVASVADIQGMFTAIKMGEIKFGGGRFYIPGFASQLGTTNNTAAGCNGGTPCPAVPPLGSIVMPSNGVYFLGHGVSSVGGNTGDTEFLLCTGTNSPFPGCVAPVTREWPIHNVTLTHVAGSNGGDYLGFVLSAGTCSGGCNIPGQNTSAASDIAAGEIVRAVGSSVASTNGDWRVCSTINGAGNFAYNATIGDPGCPAPPLAVADGATTTFYVRTNGGLVAASVSGGGAGYGNTSNTSIVFSGCTHNPTADLTVTAGAISAINIHYPGDCRGTTPTFNIYTGSPAVLNNSATLNLTLAGTCIASCGTLRATLYMFNGGPGGSTNAFNRGLSKLYVNCNNVNDWGGSLDLYANESVTYDHLNFMNCVERAIDRHTVQAQNAPEMNDIRIILPTATNVTVGTGGMYLGDVATHGVKGFTCALGSGISINDCLRIDAVGAPGVTVENGHGEQVQAQAIVGQGAPSDVVHFMNWAGPPTIQPVADGAFQNERTCALRYSANFAFITSGQGLLDFGSDSIARNGNVNIFNICDEVTTAITGFDAFQNDYATTRWDVDFAGGVLNTLTTSSFGSNMQNGFMLPFLIKNGSPFGGAIKYTVTACEASFGDTTLSLAGTTTNTGVNCLPQATIIDAVLYTVTQTITTAANFQIGDNTTAGRFCTAQAGLTAGTTGICAQQWFSATAGTMGQLAAASVRITTNVNPGAGKIRLVVLGHTFNTLNF